MARKSTFTSYVNVEPAQGVDAALARLEQKTNATFARIARSAAAAGNATVGGGVGAAGVAGLAASERTRAAAIQRTTSAMHAQSAASGRLAGSHLLESNAARAAAKSTSQLERALRLSAVAANVAQGPLGPVAGRLSAAATAVRELSGARLGFVGIAAGTAAFARFAGAAQDVKSQLRPLFDSQAQVNAAFKETQRIALDARTSLAPIVDLYARLTLAGRDAGLSQQRTSRLVEIAAKAAKLSGGAATSQEAALFQFSQGIGSGTLAGDELKSVREGALRLAKAIADGLGVPIAKLKELGKEGKLTPKVIADALEKESARIDAELAKLPPTISSATSKLSNAFTALINGTDEAYGITTVLAGSMALLADNLGLVVKAGVALAITYASIRAVSLADATVKRIDAYNAERTAVIANAKEQVAAAQTTRRASADRIVALRSERTAINANLAAQKALADSTRATALAASRRVNSGDFIGAPREFAFYRKAVDDATLANKQFANSKVRLSEISGQLSSQTTVLTNSTQAYRVATSAAARASNVFANAARGLWAAINPVGIAVGIGINLLLQYALAEDRAAGAADRMAESQNRLAKFIDFTTGKLINQNAALVQNELLTLRGQETTALADYNKSRRQVGSSATGSFSLGQGGATLKVDPRIKAITDQFDAGRINAARAAARIGGLQGLDKSSQFAADRITGQLGQVVTSAQEAVQASAARRVLAGKGTPEELRRAQGNFTGAEVSLGGASPDKTAAGDGKVAKGRKERAKATDGAAKAERELNAAQERSDKRTDILSRYDQQPTALDRAAKDARELDQLVGKSLQGGGIYTQAMADGDRQRIDFGVRQPIRDAFKEQERGLEISKLRLAGYDLEADALERALSLQDGIGKVTREEFDALVANERQQLAINDALDSRQRQVSQILDLAQQTRDAFEDLLVGTSKGNILGSLKKFGNTIADNFIRIQARQLTEKLFAGADAKLRELVSGSSGVDRAASILEKNVVKTSTSVDRLVVANDNAASAAENFAARVNGAANSIGGGEVIGAPGLVFNRALGSPAARDGLGDIFDAVVASAAAARGSASGTGPDFPMSESNPDGYIGVERSRKRKASPLESGQLPNATQAVSAVFGKKAGEAFGKVFKGAGEGVFASGIAKAIGIKQSKTGAAIGGAIGGATGIPGAGFVGGLIGGTIGGLFKKSKTGSSTISVGADGLALAGSGTGNSGAQKKIATGLAGGVSDSLNRIAEQLGGALGGTVSVSIGKRDKNFVVDTAGTGKTKGAGTKKFKDEAEAIAFALMDAIKDGVITGISAASQRILQSGQDLERAIVKATAIESIPKRLLQRTDPVRFAVQQLNDEFTKLIAYLNEGGASPEQFADAQKLYDLERADAIKQATTASVEALQAFLDEMTGGTSSPFNKATVYENSATKLNAFRADIAGGKAVDQNDLLTAAKNFQDASRELNGSSQSFFTDFNDIFALIGKARDNVTGSGTGGTLPGSPFDATKVTSAIADQVAATNDQTAVLGAKLDSIVYALNAGSYGGSSIGLLPGFMPQRDFVKAA